MQKQWRNIAIILAVLVITFLLYTFIPSFLGPQSFEAEYLELQKIWVAEGLYETGLHAQADSIGYLSQEQLSDLKQSISDFSAQARYPSTKKIATAYILLINSVLYSQEYEDLTYGMEAENVCLQISVFEKIKTILSKKLNLSVEYADEVNSFTVEYPVEAELISLSVIPDERFNEGKQEIEAYNTLLNEVKTLCAQ